MLMEEQPDQAPISQRAALLARILGAFFIVIGGIKLTGLARVEQTFVEWGYPGWFMIVIGGIEAASGVLLFARSTAAIGALAIGGVMLGAIATHARAGEWAALVLPTVVLVLVGRILRDRGRVNRQPRESGNGIPSSVS